MKKTRIEKIAFASTAIHRLRFRAATARERLACAHYQTLKHLVYLLIALVPLVLVPPAFPQSTTAGVRLQAGFAKEDVDGDLKSAMEIYQKIADDRSAPRDVRSQALLRLAGCYEKLGQQAQKVYEQVVRDFADQPAAAKARTRLAALRQAESAAGPATMTQRRIELPVPDAVALPRTDGRREAYVDANTGALVISDLAGKGKRVVFNPKAGERIVDHDISRDSSAALLALYGADGLHLALVRNDGTGYREWGPVPRGAAGDLSWDNRYVFDCGTDPDGSRQLRRYSTSDGQVRTVRMACGEWNRPSPDGRFLAISESFRNFGKVSVAPIEGGEPQLVSDNARVIDWTRDGRYLILASARSGSEALYLFPVKDGRRSGDSILLRYGPCQFGWVNAEGALICEFTQRPAGGYTAGWLGRLDSSGRSVEWKEWNPSAGSTPWYLGWSPDSSRFAYAIEGAVRLHDLASGDDREVYRGAGYTLCAWPENAELICAPHSAQPPIEVFSVSLDSGRVQSLGTVPEFAGGPIFRSAAGQSIYMWGTPDQQGLTLSLIRWDLATRQTTIVERFTVGDLVTNPTERWIARRNEKTIEIRPTAGGEWTPLISLPTTPMAFTPDGNWLLFHDVDAAGKHGLFRVSTSGGERERIGDFPTVPQEPSLLYVSPDGRKLLFQSHLGQQVWILENFEPKQQDAR
jgi:hypothetical protein